MSWSFTVDEAQDKAQLQGLNIKELVSFDPPITNHPDGAEGVIPGVLVTYSPGGKHWSGRGQQTYYPAKYTVHVVTQATHSENGKWYGHVSRHVDVPCQPSKARR